MFSGVFAVGLLRLLSIGLSIGATVLLARLLGPAALGAYSFAFSVSSVVLLAALQGIPIMILREVSAASVQERWHHAQELLRYTDTLQFRVFLGSLLLVAAIMLAGFSIGPVSGFWLALPAMALPLVMVAGLARSSVVRSYGKALAGHLPEMLVRPLLFVLFLGGLWFLPASYRTSAVAMSLHLLAALVALVFSMLLLRRLSAALPAYPASGRQSCKGHLRTLIPLSAVAGLQLANSQVDLIALGLLSPAHDVGVYRIATTLALQVSFGLTIINAVVAPKFVVLYRDSRISELVRLNRLGAAGSFGLGFIVVAIYFLWGERLIIFTAGEQFLPAFIPLLILSVAHLLTLWAGTTNVLLNMIGREGDVLLSVVASLVTNVALNGMLIPLYGIIGAAIATSVSLVVWRLLLSYFVRSHLSDKASA